MGSHRGDLDESIRRLRFDLERRFKGVTGTVLPRTLLGETLLLRGGDGDRDAGFGELARAADDARELGMPAYAERAQRSLARAGVSPESGRVGELEALHGLRVGLTPREREVLDELAQGRPDKLIADRLCISVRTVQRHVGSILAKTGCTNRTEAALLCSRIR